MTRSAAPTITNSSRNRLQTIYDRLWSESIDRIRTGNVDLDPVLHAGVPDLRRGLTLIARPGLKLRKAAMEFLEVLRKLEPAQYYYTGSQLHVTILSLFTATTNPGPFLENKARYVQAIRATLKNFTPIEIQFKGVTVSSGSVMLQGFLADNSLNELRDRLRQQLNAIELGDGLDRRYRLETAHMTVARFRSRLMDPPRFANELERDRNCAFGTSRVRSLILVENDWYMSSAVTRAVARYRLERTENR